MSRGDRWLIVLPLALTGVGVIMVYSSSAILGITRYQDPNHFLFKQLFRAILDATHQEGQSSTLYSNIYDLKNGEIFELTVWLHKMPTGHAPSTFNRRVKPAFLLPHDLSLPVGLAPLPALSPRRCKQGWYNARGEGLRVRGHAGFMQR